MMERRRPEVGAIVGQGNQDAHRQSEVQDISLDRKHVVSWESGQYASRAECTEAYA